MVDVKRWGCLLFVLVLLSVAFAAGAEEIDAANWYEVFVYSYQDSDGDGIGDLNGLRQRLDYIDEMGFDGLWLMPIMPSPSYHKYDVTDYYGIDPLYGTVEDLKALAAECHARGIRLILDLVVNHSSSQHPWFLEATEALRQGHMDNPYLDYYCFSQQSGDKMVPVSGTDWYYEEQFSGGGMPDLNLDSPAVMEEIRSIMRFWLVECDVDGFRLDAVTSYYTGSTPRNVDVLHQLKAMAEEIKPGSYMIGEAWTNLPEITHYYESGMDSFFLFPASQGEGYIASALRSSQPAASYVGSLAQVEESLPNAIWAPFLSNHDTGRTVGSVQGRTSPAKLKFAHGILNMMGGNTFTYYGEEIGMAGSGDDPNKRTAMYWSDDNMTQNPPGVTKVEYPYPSAVEQMADPDSLLNYIRKVNLLKQQIPAIARGEHRTVYYDDFLCLLRRDWQGEQIYIAINFSPTETLTLTLPGEINHPVVLGELNANGGACLLNTANTSISLPPYAIAILKNVDVGQSISIPETMQVDVSSDVPTRTGETSAENSVVIKLHYHRPDESYDGWDVWFWPYGMEGAGYPFVEEDGDMVATFEAAPDITKVGFIVRTADWTKDINADQFIEFPDVSSGVIHIYVESGVPGYTQDVGEEADTAIRVTGARYDFNAGTVTAMLTAPLEGNPAEAFHFLDAAGNEIAIADATAVGSRTYTLTLGETLDLFEEYRMIFEGNEYAITMPNIYSTDSFEAAYTYAGNDLGAIWSTEKTTFRVWAPTAKSVTVNLYAGGAEGTDDLLEQLPMSADLNGTWVAEKDGNLHGVYYTYAAEVNGQLNETVDPYARTTGVNGKRAMVIDLASTDPEGWENDANPNASLTYNDAIIYELHVRDLSADESSGIMNVGKYLGLTETGTTTPGGVPTGLDHIRELGVTHVHLLPVYDYGSVDETRLDEFQFNWGYDPVNYNVPEGSYATDPYNGEVRVREMKQMIQALHQSGLSVVMDVVYNHVYDAGSFCVNQLVPGYFSRVSENGTYSNASGCGNDTASERSMVRKYIVDSVSYWADEYHIDGFRFDLVGLLDTQTINEIIEEVHKKHPDVLFYGEGWSMNTAVTKSGVKMATQANAAETPGFAFFNDTIRDALKGSVFDKQPGYVSGAPGLEDTIRQTFTGRTSWCATPAQTINYASCHDNNTLMDRIALATPDASREDQIRMNNLAAAIYLTAEGIPFMQAGEEMLRTKINADNTFNENSYNASDAVNSLKWYTLETEEYRSVYEYYKGLIAFRKAHEALRLTSAEEVDKHVFAVEDLPANVVAFHIDGPVDELFVIFNANPEARDIALPEGTWDVCVNGEWAGLDILATVADGVATVEPISAMILVKQ